MAYAKATYGGQQQYEEIDNDEVYGIALSRSGRRDTRHFYVSNSNLPAFLVEMFPGGGALPGRHPTVSYLWVDDVEIRGYGKAAGVSSGVAYWDRWQASVTYSPLPIEEEEQQQGETFITRRKTFGGEYMTLPGAHLKWDDDTRIKEDEVVAAKLIPIIEHVITLHRVQSINDSLIRTCIGNVNNTTFEGASAETMLFMGADTNYTIATDGTQQHTVELRWQEKRIKVGASTYGWNHFFRPGTGAWEKIKNDAGDYIYEDTDKFPQLLIM